MNPKFYTLDETVRRKYENHVTLARQCFSD